MSKSSPQKCSKSSNLDESFKDILPTPDGTEPVHKKVNCRNANNYKAQKVTKHLFEESIGKLDISKLQEPSTTKTSKLLEFWYCSICDTDKHFTTKNVLALQQMTNRISNIQVVLEDFLWFIKYTESGG
ncbi:hypothetical protein JTB14_024478 [Gonioctena quinquepunctata]|nr:hypothetical protein JTB14_024478 [Gonioctena quinquepunctata]